MHIAFQTIIFGPRIDDIELALDIIAKEGYSGVEISQRPDMLRIRVDKTDLETRCVTSAELLGLLKERGLTLLGLAGGTLSERMDFCDAFQDISLGKIRPLYLYVTDLTDEIVIQAAERGFNLALHTHAYMKNSRLEDATRLLNRYSFDKCPHVGWMPDVAHITIVGDSPLKAITEYGLRSRLVCVHIKDWDQAYGRSYHRYAKGFTELGRGEVEIEPVIKELLRTGYDGWLVVEQDYTKTDVKQSARLSAQWLTDQGVTVRRVESTPEPAIMPNWHLTLRKESCPAERQVLFTKEMLRAGAQDLQDCYATVAGAATSLCQARFGALWACSPARGSLSLLAVHPASDGDVSHTWSYNSSLSKVAADRLAVTVFDPREDSPAVRYGYPNVIVQCADLTTMADASRLVILPAISRYNPCHVMFIVTLFFDDDDVPLESSSGFWAEDLFWFGLDMARAVDTTLDDLCAYAASKASILAGRRRSVREFVNGIMLLMQEFVECEGITIFLLDATRARLEPEATTGLDWNVPDSEHFYRLGEGLTGAACMRAEPHLVLDAPTGVGWKGKSHETGVDETRTDCLFVPLITSRGESLGVVRCRNKQLAADGHAPVFTEVDSAVIDAIAHAAVPHLEAFLGDEQRSRSVHRITHELAQPLGAIRACTQFMQFELKEYGSEPANFFHYDYLGDVWSWTELMDGVLTNADIYGMKVGPLVLNPERCFLRAQIFAPAERHVRMLLRDRSFKSSSIDYSGVQAVPPLFIDRSRFFQVAFNLLSNAIKYALPDPARFKVQISGSRLADAIEIQFKDWGPGLPEGDTETLFLEGVRGRKASNDYVVGQGLGLWVVRRVVEAHGGTIAVTRRGGPSEDEGAPTQFTIRLPLTLQR